MHPCRAARSQGHKANPSYPGRRLLAEQAPRADGALAVVHRSLQVPCPWPPVAPLPRRRWLSRRATPAASVNAALKLCQTQAEYVAAAAFGEPGVKPMMSSSKMYVCRRCQANFKTGAWKARFAPSGSRGRIGSASPRKRLRHSPPKASALPRSPVGGQANRFHALRRFSWRRRRRRLRRCADARPAGRGRARISPPQTSSKARYSGELATLARRSARRRRSPGHGVSRYRSIAPP